MYKYKCRNTENNAKKIQIRNQKSTHKIYIHRQIHKNYYWRIPRHTKNSSETSYVCHLNWDPHWRWLSDKSTFSPGHQCGDEEEAEDDDGSDSEKEESDEDSEPPGDFDPPPVFTLLQTLSSLSDNDQKRAVLALQLQLNSIIDNKWDLHGDLYASFAGGIYSYVRFCPCNQNYSVFAYVTYIKTTYYYLRLRAVIWELKKSKLFWHNIAFSPLSSPIFHSSFSPISQIATFNST